MATASTMVALTLMGLLLALVDPSLATTGYNAGSNVACPTNPLGLCSFYFTGYSSALYSFAISTTSPDKTFGPAILFSGNTSLTIAVSNSGPPVFFGSVPSGTTCNGYNSRINDFFYLAGSPSKLVRRSYNQVNAADVTGRCVLLQIDSAQVTINGKTVTNLNPNDGNNAFPQDKRCILFKTT